MDASLETLLQAEYVLAARTPVPVGRRPGIEAWVRRDRAVERGIGQGDDPLTPNR